MMAQLGGAHRATYWNGQLVLKGFETLFVPVKKADTCIVWHLVTKSNRRRVSYNSAEKFGQKCEQPVYVGDLLEYRHFLGWVGSASQHAGELFENVVNYSPTDATQAPKMEVMTSAQTST